MNSKTTTKRNNTSSGVKDPFFEAVYRALGEKLDPDLFETCVADLLRLVFPGIMPIRGGQDSGMDAAIPDGKGRPCPLVATTRQDVIGNLTLNLKSYLNDGMPRRKAVLATSQILTARRRANLHKRAEELGFTLVQIVDRSGLVPLLYRSPLWHRQLLGLTGEQPALSRIPRLVRPLLKSALIGRQDDLKWLRENFGDRIIHGPPAVGKTFLLNQLAGESGALFVATRDKISLANAVREVQPAIVMADDAGADLDLLLDLRHLREETGATFDIVAACWSVDVDRVIVTMAISERHCREIGLMSRDEIVEVVREAGIQGPDSVIREIVDQASGRPGLAATLAYAALDLGGTKALIRGEPLARALRAMLQSIGCGDSISMLGAIALGGTRGVSMRQLCSILEMPLHQARGQLVTLGSLGLIQTSTIGDAKDYAVSVFPEALREILVRDVFGGTSAPLPLVPFLRIVRSTRDALMTLIGARARGALIERGLLLQLLQDVAAEDAWVKFCWLGKAETELVLEALPDFAVRVSKPALHHCPETAIPMLLYAAIDDDRQLHSSPNHPLRRVRNWVRGARKVAVNATPRRKILLDAISKWLSSNGDDAVALRAACMAMAPEDAFWSTDPGSGRGFTHHSRYLTCGEIRSLQDLWPAACEIIAPRASLRWADVSSLIWSWAQPGAYIIEEVSDDQRQEMIQFAEVIISDIIPFANERPAILHELRQISTTANLNIAVPAPTEFDILFPAFENVEDKINMTSEHQKVAALADNLVIQDPVKVGERLKRHEDDAASAGTRWPRLTPRLASRIAEITDTPHEWASSFIDALLPADLIEPLLKPLVKTREEGWAELFLRCLQSTELLKAAISIGLTEEKLPTSLLNAVVRSLEGWDIFVNYLALNGELSICALPLLLAHENSEVAFAAAIGLWIKNPEQPVAPSLAREWDEAILRFHNDDFWLRKLLQAKPGLAYRWLLRCAEDADPYDAFRIEKSIVAAFSALQTNDRISILKKTSYPFVPEDALCEAATEDLDFYRALLRCEELSRYHLMPLVGQPKEMWSEKAELALAAGYSPKMVADASYPTSMFWTGDESKMWQEWVDAWAKLCSHEEPQIAEVGEMGRRVAESRRDAAIKRENAEKIWGMDEPR